MTTAARLWIGVGATNGLIAVAAGAFGAHILEARLDARMLETFELAVRYQMYHGLALFPAAWLISVRRSRLASGAALCMLVGTVIFCGTLYGLSLSGLRWLGAVTPIGGGLLILGWLFLAAAAFQPTRRPQLG